MEGTRTEGRRSMYLARYTRTTRWRYRVSPLVGRDVSGPATDRRRCVISGGAVKRHVTCG